MDPNYPLYPISAFICMILSLIPLPWLFAHWNTGAWMYAFWVSIGCFIHGVNAIIWKDNTENIAPVWCDISTRFYIGQSVAIPAASLAITRRIYLMFSMKRPLAGTRVQRRNAVLFDLGLTLGIPILEMTVFYVIQGHRFNIIEEFGCSPTNVNTWLAFLLCYSWPLALGLTSCVYGTLIFRIYLTHFQNLNRLNFPNDMSRYYRSLALSCADAVFTVPCSIVVIVTNAQAGLRPWTTWADMHYNFSRVHHVSSNSWRSAGSRDQFVVYWNAWVSPACALVFFFFFGLTKEVRNGYARIFITLLHKLGLGFRRRHFRSGSKSPPSSSVPEISEFKVASVQGTTTQAENQNMLFTSVLSNSMFEASESQDTESQNTTQASENDKVSPFEMDSLKAIDLHCPDGEPV